MIPSEFFHTSLKGTSGSRLASTTKELNSARCPAKQRGVRRLLQRAQENFKLRQAEAEILQLPQGGRGDTSFLP